MLGKSMHIEIICGRRHNLENCTCELLLKGFLIDHAIDRISISFVAVHCSIVLYPFLPAHRFVWMGTTSVACSTPQLGEEEGGLHHPRVASVPAVRARRAITTGPSENE